MLVALCKRGNNVDLSVRHLVGTPLEEQNNRTLQGFKGYLLNRKVPMGSVGQNCKLLTCMKRSVPPPLLRFP